MDQNMHFWLSGTKDLRDFSQLAYCTIDYATFVKCSVSLNYVEIGLP